MSLEAYSTIWIEYYTFRHCTFQRNKLYNFSLGFLFSEFFNGYLKVSPLRIGWLTDLAEKVIKIFQKMVGKELER